MRLQIACFDKTTIARKEGTADRRAFFFSSSDNFVVTKIETQTEVLNWVIVIFNLDDLSIFIAVFVILFVLLRRANAQNDVGLTEDKILYFFNSD